MTLVRFYPKMRLFHEIFFLEKLIYRASHWIPNPQAYGLFHEMNFGWAQRSNFTSKVDNLTD
jgi:hypothetical protein